MRIVLDHMSDDSVNGVLLYQKSTVMVYMGISCCILGVILDSQDRISCVICSVYGDITLYNEGYPGIERSNFVCAIR